VFGRTERYENSADTYKREVWVQVTAAFEEVAR
jgi:hypothetical protein